MKKKSTLTKNELNLVKAFESILPQKSTGGQLLATAASFVPGYGAVISPIVSMVDGLIDKSKAEQNKPSIPAKVFNNPYGQLAMGGVINKGFKQYSTGSHVSGNDQPVDQNGMPNTMNPVASVQNKENMFVVDNKPFVMSDVLINPETGNTINKDAAKINSKYSNAATISEEKNALKFDMKRLSKLNDGLKMMQESLEQKFNGGEIFNTANKMVSNAVTSGYSGLAFQNHALFNPENPMNIEPPTPTGYTGKGWSSYPKLSDTQSDNVSFNPNEQSVERNDNTVPFTPTETKKFDWANAAAIGLKGAALIKSVADATRKPEVESPILPDYTKSDRYMQSANIDYTQARQNALGVSNMAGNMNRTASNNFAAFQGREQARFASLQDAIGNIDMQENNARSQLNLTRGQYEQGKAVDTAGRLSQNRIDNFQNLAQSRLAGEKLFTELSQIGTEFNKYSNYQKEITNNKELQQYYIKEGLSLLNNKYSNFQLDPSFVSRLQAGESLDTLVKFYPNEVQKLVSTVDGLKKETK